MVLPGGLGFRVRLHMAAVNLLRSTVRWGTVDLAFDLFPAPLDQLLEYLLRLDCKILYREVLAIYKMGKGCSQVHIAMKAEATVAIRNDKEGCFFDFLNSLNANIL